MKNNIAMTKIFNLRNDITIEEREQSYFLAYETLIEAEPFLRVRDTDLVFSTIKKIEDEMETGALSILRLKKSLTRILESII